MIAEVKLAARRGSLSPQLVRVPGILVDAVVVNPEAWQIHGVERYNPAVSGSCARRGVSPRRSHWTSACWSPAAPRWRSVRAPCSTSGFGISDGVPVVAAQEGLLDDLTITIEQGTIGGLPMRGRALAAQSNVEAIVDQISQFNFYQGGGWTWRSCRSPRSTLPGTSTSASSAASRGAAVHRHLPERQGGRLRPVREGGGHAWRTAPPRRRPRAGGPAAGGARDLQRPARGGRRKRATSPSGPSSASARGRARARARLRPRADVLAEMEFRPIIATDLRPMDPVIFEPRRSGSASGGCSVAWSRGRPWRGVTGAPRPFRFGLIGAGVAAEIHVAAMRTVPGVEVFAIADVVPERARALAARYAIPEVYESGEALASRAPVDAVAVLTPHHPALPYVLAAASAKDTCSSRRRSRTTVAAADELIEACRTAA